MTPLKTSASGNYFPLLQDAFVDVNLGKFFARLRVLRHPATQTPQIYYLTENPVYVTEEGTDYVVYTHLQLGLIGAANVPNVLNLYRSSTPYMRTIQKIYLNAILRKPKLPKLTRWLEQQIDAYFNSGYGLLHRPPHKVSMDPYQYTFAYIDIAIIKEGPTPNWDNFLSQMIPEDQKIFAAFVYSALDEQNTGRQALVVYDRKSTGATGKSSAAYALTQGALEQVSGTFIDSMIKNRFALSSIVDKRLLIWPDCKNMDFLKSDLFHSITGGDIMSVEKKYEGAYTTTVYAKLLILANDPPQASLFRKHETSRLILIELDASVCKDKSHIKNGVNLGNSNFKKALVLELPYFLHYCRECYGELSPSRMEIIVNRNNVLKADDEEGDLFVRAFLEYFEIDPKYCMSAGEMSDILTSIWGERKVTSKRISNWKVFLSTYDVMVARSYMIVKGTEQRITVYKGIRKKEEHSLRIPSPEMVGNLILGDELGGGIKWA